MFEGVATGGKTSVGWFFGFKLHLVINHMGGIVNFAITRANVDDRTPVEDLCGGLFGILTGDKGI